LTAHDNPPPAVIPYVYGLSQTPAAARLAHILNHAATELWDLCTEPDAAQMWEDARAIASRILAACPGD